MNREILFRGKRIDNGEWTADYLVTYDNEVGIYQPFGDSGCAFNPKSVEIIGNVYDRKEAYND